MASVFQPIAVDGAPAAFPGTDGLFASVNLAVEEGTVALVSLYGEVRANAGTTVERVVSGLSWQASFASSKGGAGDFQPITLESKEGSGGRLTWTYSDGRELARLVQRGPGTLRWGAYRTSVPPAGVTHALARVRGVVLPSSIPAEELARMLVLWRGGV